MKNRGRRITLGAAASIGSFLLAAAFAGCGSGENDGDGSGGALATSAGGTSNDGGTSSGAGEVDARASGNGTATGGSTASGEGSDGGTSGGATGSGGASGADASSGSAGSSGTSGSDGGGLGGSEVSTGAATGGASTSSGTSSSSDGGGNGSGGASGGTGTSSGGTSTSSGGTSTSSGGTSTSGGAMTTNDQFWKDTSGSFIYSQGGGVLQVGDTYYWYGVKYGGAVTYAANPTGKNDDTSFQGVTTYSSKDLSAWKLEATDKVANAGGWFGRLGVAYNSTTKKYVLVAQGGGGLYFATSDRPNGGFTYDHVQTNLPGIANGATGDQTLFQDDDGQAYLISSSSNGRSNRYVSPLRASDFLAAETAIPVYKGGGREGNCMFKYQGQYYFCSSDLHGWNSSHTYCVSASNIRGPWGAEFVLDGTDADFSHVTQTGFFIQVKGSAQTTIIFAGDRWSDFAGNGLGFNQWMPLSFTGTTPHFHSLSQWWLDVKTGNWGAGPGNNWVLNPTFEADRVSVTTPAGWTSTGGSNVSGGRTGRWSWQLSGNSSLAQSITSLPNGTYTLSVWAKSSAAGGQLYVKNFGGTDKTAAIPSGSAWTKVSIADIAETSGRAEVGVTGSGQTITLDDFTLVSGGQ